MGEELVASHTGPCTQELKAAPRILQKLPQNPKAKRRQGYSLIVNEMEEGLKGVARFNSILSLDAGGTRTIKFMFAWRAIVGAFGFHPRLNVKAALLRSRSFPTLALATCNLWLRRLPALQ